MDQNKTSAVRFLPVPFVRIVSLVLSLTILVGDPSWAAGVSDLVRISFSHDLRDLSVPAKFGTVTDHWIAPAPAGSRFVVLIQDLHANISVQKNISSIIEYLYHRARVSSIYAEAAFGPCDVSVLRTLPSRRVQTSFEEELLSKALITGDEMAASRIGHGSLSPVKLEGIDDPLLYLANVQAFGDLVKIGPDAAREWKSLKEVLMPGAAPQLRSHLELMEKLLSLKLLDNEWLEYKEHRNLTPHASPRFMAALAAAERFYTAAEARNGALTENLLAKLTPQTSVLSPVVLVTGGFHTASIAHVLKQRGIGFMVVTPQVNRLDQEELYIQSMTEPPHETVRALLPSDYLCNMAMLSKLMKSLNMGERLTWARVRKTIIPKAIGAKYGALKPNFSWLDSFGKFWEAVVAVGLIIVAASGSLFTFVHHAAAHTVTHAAQMTQGVVQFNRMWPVRTGQTLSGIAHHLGTTVAQLTHLNPQITNPHVIYAGKELVTPTVIVTHPLPNAIAGISDQILNTPVSHGPAILLWAIPFVAITLGLTFAWVRRSYFIAKFSRPASRKRVRTPSTPEVILSIWKDRWRALKINPIWARVVTAVTVGIVAAGSLIHLDASSRTAIVTSPYAILPVLGGLGFIFSGLRGRLKGRALNGKRILTGIALLLAGMVTGVILSRPPPSSGPQSFVPVQATSSATQIVPNDQAQKPYTPLHALKLKTFEKGETAKEKLAKLQATRAALEAQKDAVAHARQALVDSLLQTDNPFDPQQFTLEQVVDTLAQLNPSRFSAAAQAIRTSAPAFAQDTRVANLDRFAAQLSDILARLQALQTKDISTLLPEEAAGYIQTIQAELESLRQSSSMDLDLKTLSGLLNGGGALSEDAQSAIDQVVVSLQDGRIESAQAGLRGVRNTLVDFTTLEASKQVLNDSEASLNNREKEIQQQLKTEEAEQALAIPRDERVWVADKIQETLGDISLTEGDELLAKTETAAHWHYAFAQAQHALHVITEERERLLDDSVSPSEQLESSRKALLAFGDLKSVLPALAIFDSVYNPSFPSEAKDLPEAARFEAYFRHLRSGIAFEHLHTLLTAVIGMTEDQKNIDIQVQERRATAEAQEKASTWIEMQETHLTTEKKGLQKLDEQITAKAKMAATLAPHASVNSVIDRETLKMYLRTVNGFKLDGKIFSNSSDPFVAAVRNLKTVTTDLEAGVESSGALSDEESQKFSEALSGVLDHFQDFIGGGNVQFARAPRQTVHDIQTFIRETVLFSVQYYGGMSLSRLHEGVTPQDTFENRAMRLLGTVSQAAELNADQVRFAHYLDRTTGWQGWADIALKGFNTVYGFKHLSQNYNTLIGHNRFAFEVRAGDPVSNPTGGVIYVHFKLVAQVNPIGPMDTVLALANGYMSASGLVNATRIVLTGEDPHVTLGFYAAHLDPKLFGGLTWQQHAEKVDVKPGVIYFDFGDGNTLEASKTLSAANVQKSDNWQKVTSDFPMAGHFYVTVGEDRYIWVSGKDALSVGGRIDALTQAVNSAVLLKPIAEGFLTGDAFRKHLVDVPADIFTRYSAALQLHGLGKTGVEFVDALRYQKTVDSAMGGWLNGKAPRFVATVKATSIAGKPIVVRIGTNGEMYYERRDENNELVLDDSHGTPVFRYHRSLLRALSDFVYEFRLSSVQYYQVSKKLAHASVEKSEGFYVKERRPRSAPFLLDDGADQVRVWNSRLGDWDTLILGPSLTIQDGDDHFEARPYYAPSKNPDLSSTYLGIIRLQPDGQLHLVPVGKTEQKQIDPKSIYTLVTTLRQEMNDFQALVQEGSWRHLNDIQAQILEKKDGWPQGEGLRGNGGVELFAREGEDPTFIRWVDPQGTGLTYLIDQTEPLKKKVYRYSLQNGLKHVEYKVTSFQDLAKAQAQPTEVGTWFKDKHNDFKLPTRAQIFNVSGAPEAKIWLGTDGAWHMYLEKTTSVGGHLQGKGLYHYELGGVGAKQAEAGIEAPLIRRQALPESIDLDSLVRRGGVTRIGENGPQGSETWYYFNQLTPETDAHEIVGAFVRYTQAGKTFVDAISFSKSGLAYQAQALRTTEPTFWSLRLAPPQGATKWFGGELPAAIKDYINGQPAEAAYAYDPTSQDIFLRVTVQSGDSQAQTIYFHNETTPQGERAIAQGQAADGSWAPLGMGLPDVLIKGMPGFKSGSFKKMDGEWHYALAARDRVKAELSTHPQLASVYSSMNEMPVAEKASLRPTPHAVMGRLTSDYGIGAENVKGHWYQKNVREGRQSMPVWLYFEVGPQGGRYTDAVTKKEVVLKPGSVWAIHNTIAGTKSYLQFQQGNIGQWKRPQVDNNTFLAQSDLDASSKGAHPYVIPGTTVTGDLLRPAHLTPFAPTVLKVKEGGQIDGETVHPGDLLIYQIPASLQVAVANAEQGAMAVLVDPSQGSVKSLKVQTPNDPKLGGIMRIRDYRTMPGADLSQLMFPYSDDTLIQVDAQGHVKGQIGFTESGYRALEKMEAGYGYIQMKPGTHAVTLYRADASGWPTKKTWNAPLAGWIGIGEAPGQIRMQDLRANMQPLDGEDFASGAVLLDYTNPTQPVPVGNVIFGVKAPAGDPALTGKNVAAIHYIRPDGRPDRNHRPSYLTQDQLDHAQGHMMQVVKTAEKGWVPAYFDLGNNQWYELIPEKRVQAGHEELYLVPAPHAFATQPNYTEKSPIGLFKLAEDGKFEMAGLVEFQPANTPEEKAKRPSVSLSQEELMRSYGADQLLQLAIRDGRMRLEVNVRDGITNVLFEHRITRRLMSQQMFGNQVIARTYYEDPEGKAEEAKVWFGSGGIRDPRLKVVPVTGQPGRYWASEVIQTLRSDDHSFALNVYTFSLKERPAFDMGKPWQAQWSVLLKKAKTPLPNQIVPPAGVQEQDFERLSDGSYRLVQDQYFYGPFLWVTHHDYADTGAPVGLRTSIRLRSSGKEIASRDVQILAPAKAADQADENGRRVFSDRLLEQAHITGDTWVVRANVKTSWGTTYTDYRLYADPRLIFFIQGADRRLTTGFDGPYPTQAVILNADDLVIKTVSSTDFVNAEDVLSNPVLEQLYGQMHDITVDSSVSEDQKKEVWKRQFWDHMALWNITPKTPLPRVVQTDQLLIGNTDDPHHMKTMGEGSKETLVLFPGDPLGEPVAVIDAAGNLRINKFGSKFVQVPNEFPYGPTPQNFVLTAAGFSHETKADLPHSFTAPSEVIAITGDKVSLTTSAAALRSLRDLNHFTVGDKIVESFKSLVPRKILGQAHIDHRTSLSEERLAWAESVADGLDAIQASLEKGVAAHHGDDALRHQLTDLQNQLDDVIGDLKRSHLSDRTLRNLQTERFLLKMMSIELQGMSIVDYRSANSTNPLDTQATISVLANGKKIAETYLHEIGKPMKNLLGNPSLTRGLETVYYDPQDPLDTPLLSLMDGEKGPTSVVVQHVDRVVREIGSDHTERTRIEGVVRRRMAEETNVDYIVRTFRNGEVVDERDPSLPYIWFIDKYVWALAGILALCVVALKLTGDAAASLSQKWRVGKARPVSASGTGGMDPEKAKAAWLSDKEIQDLQAMLSRFGFQEDVIRIGTDNFLHARRQAMARNIDPDKFVQQYFVGYIAWRKSVLRRYDAPSLDVSHVFLDFVMLSSLDIFSTSTPAFVSFLFDSMRPTFDADRLGQLNEFSAAGSRFDGFWMKSQIARWHKILAKNVGARKDLIDPSQGRILLQSDMDGLFRSNTFVRLYRVFPNIVPQVKTALWKIFVEATGGAGGIRGWLRAAHTFNPVLSGMLILLYVVSSAAGIFSGPVVFVTGLAVLIFVLTLSGLGLGKWLETPNVLARGAARPEEGWPTHKVRNQAQNIRRRIFQYTQWVVILSAKMAWNVYIFHLLAAPTAKIWSMTSFFQNAPLANLGVNLIVLALLWSMSIAFFLYDTFSFFYIMQTVVAHVFGRHLGVGEVRQWPRVTKLFRSAQTQYAKKKIPKEQEALYTEAQKQLLFARAWNRILWRLFVENRLKEAEWQRMRYALPDESSAHDPDAEWQPDYLAVGSGSEKWSDLKLNQWLGAHTPDLTTAPANAEAAQRLMLYIEKLHMSMPEEPSWDNLRSLSILTPVYEEDVVYTFSDLNVVENTIETKLTYLIRRQPDEWNNFIASLEREKISDPARRAIRARDILRMKALHRGMVLRLEDPGIEWAVRLWASYRFQPLARTIRGQMYYRDALITKARVEFPTLNRQQIETRVDDKFQFVVAYQPYQEPGYNEYDDHHRPIGNTVKKQALHDLIRKQFHHLEIVWMGKKDGRFQSGKVVFEPGSTDEEGKFVSAYNIDLAGTPLVGDGKPSNQINGIKYLRGEALQTIDMNQDGYYEQKMMMPNLLQEFDEKPGVFLIGMPERIFTETYGKVADYAALADRTFTTDVQRYLTLMDDRFHYGHPDVWLKVMAKQTGGISSPTKVNEDIFGGYYLTLRGGNISYAEYMEEGKGREVHLITSEGLFQKFGMGNAQQATSPELSWLLTSNRFGWARRITHFFGHNGFYLREPGIILMGYLYLVSVLLLGFSPFVGMASDPMSGIIGLVLSQAVALPGIAQMASRLGWWGAIKKYFGMFFSGMLPFYQFHVFTHSAGVRKAMGGLAGYVATGRGFMLDWRNPMAILDTFFNTHLDKAFQMLVVGGLGVWIWQNPSIIWSWPFITMALSGFLAPFLFNRGASPVELGMPGFLNLTKKAWSTWRSHANPASITSPITWFRPLSSAILIGVLSLIGLSQLPSTPTRNVRETGKALLYGFMAQLPLVALFTWRANISATLGIVFLITMGRFMGRQKFRYTVGAIAAGIGLGLTFGVSIPVLWISIISFFIIRSLSANASRNRSIPAAKMVVDEILKNHADLAVELAKSEEFPSVALQEKVWDSLNEAEKIILQGEFIAGGRQTENEQENAATIVAALHSEALAAKYRAAPEILAQHVDLRMELAQEKLDSPLQEKVWMSLNDGEKKTLRDEFVNPGSLSDEEKEKMLILTGLQVQARATYNQQLNDLKAILPSIVRPLRENKDVMSSFAVATAISANKPSSEGIRFAFLANFSGREKELFPDEVLGMVNELGGLKNPAVREALYDVFNTTVLPGIKGETGDNWERFITQLSRDPEIQRILEDYEENPNHLDPAVRAQVLKALADHASLVDEVEMNGFKLTSRSFIERTHALAEAFNSNVEGNVRDASVYVSDTVSPFIGVELLQSFMWRAQTPMERWKIFWGSSLPATTVPNLMQVWLRDHWQSLQAIFEDVPWDENASPEVDMLKTVYAKRRAQLFNEAPEELRAVFDLLFGEKAEGKFIEELFRQWASAGYTSKSKKKYTRDVDALEASIRQASLIQGQDLTEAIHAWRQEFSVLSAVAIEQQFDTSRLKHVAMVAKEKDPGFRANLGGIVDAYARRIIEKGIEMVRTRRQSYAAARQNGVEELPIPLKTRIEGWIGNTDTFKESRQKWVASGAMILLFAGSWFVTPKYDIFNHMMSHPTGVQFFDALIVFWVALVATIAASEVLWGPKRMARAASIHAALYAYAIGIVYAFTGAVIHQHQWAIVAIMMLGFGFVIGRMLGVAIGQVVRLLRRPTIGMTAGIAFLVWLSFGHFSFAMGIPEIVKTLGFAIMVLSSLYLSRYFRHGESEYWRTNPLQAGSQMGDIQDETDEQDGSRTNGNGKNGSSLRPTHNLNAAA